MKRLPPSERTREAITEMLESGLAGAEDPLSELVRLATQRVVEEVLEAKTRDVLGGRGYYGRRSSSEEAGYRNGYRQGRLKTSEGEVRYGVPQVRGVDGGELKAFRRQVQGRSEALEQLAVEMYARGCSTRDIEDTFRGEDGESLLSRTAVSEVTEILWQEYKAFASRDLSEVRPLYLFLDGIAERLHKGSGKREAVLCAWAITWEGKKILVHLEPGTKESTECCRSFLENLKYRGLADPILVVTDGAPGLIRAVEECFPTSARQRCLAHRMRNLMSKLPEEIQREFKELATASYQAHSPKMAELVRDELVAKYEAEYPSAVECFLDDFDACIAYLKCPPHHRRVIRTTNLLERLFREERRRTRAVSTFFGEKPVLKLMFAALIRAAERWNGIQINDIEREQLKRLQRRLVEQHRQDCAPVVELASKSLTAEEA